MASKRIRDYEVEGKLGSGGMGSVYLARHIHLGSKAAIKILHNQFTADSSIRERFINEARLMSDLRHPAIVEQREFFEENGSLVLVMEYIEGRSLDEMIGSEIGPITWERALPLFMQVLDGMAFAHSRGIVHRDVKPANILVSSEGRVKLTDFGIAKISGQKGLTKTGTKLGTIYYMSPEQIRGSRDVDHRADIYSLGMTLYEMLAGRLPFGEEDTTSEFRIMKTIVDSNIPDPREFYPHIPENIVSVIRNATASDLDSRIQDCDQFRNMLEGGSMAEGDASHYWSQQVSQGSSQLETVGSLGYGSDELSTPENACSQCGVENDPGARFCSSCGAKMGNSCPSCGRELEPNAAFCPDCGVRLEQTAKAPAHAAQTPVADPAQDRYQMSEETKQVERITNKRIGAILLDLIIIFTIAGALVAGFDGGAGAVTLLSMVIFAFKDSFNGKSIGKMASKIRVAEAKTGKPANFGRTLARNAVLAIPFFFLVEFCAMLLRKDKRRLGDLIAGTQVIED